MSVKSGKPVEERTTRPWQRPTLKAVGRVGDVLRSGGGKITVLTGDPGEPLKVGPTG